MYIGNKHLKQICIVIIVSMLYSCAESQKDDAVLRVEICESDEAICAAEMVDTVSLVALKESDACMVGEIKKIEETGEHYFVKNQKKNMIARFSKDGEFVDKLQKGGSLQVGIYRDKRFLCGRGVRHAGVAVRLYESDGLRFVVQQKENLHAGYPSGKGLRVWFPDIWLQFIGQQCGFCVRRGDTGRCPRNKAGIMGVLAVTGLFFNRMAPCWLQWNVTIRSIALMTMVPANTCLSRMMIIIKL